MMSRCYRPKDARYSSYGGRGIRVCERWRLSVAAFTEDMGVAPKGMTLDRIDNDGDYTPENCRWASPAQQRENRRDSVRFDVGGKKITAKALSEAIGVQVSTIYWRRRAGWTFGEIVAGKRAT